MRQLCLLISVPMNEEFTGIPMSIIAIDWKVAVGNQRTEEAINQWVPH